MFCQSLNIIDPQEDTFSRDFIIGLYYLSLYGTKVENGLYRVDYTRTRIDGTTLYYKEVLNLVQLNERLSQLEDLDSKGVHRTRVIDHLKKNKEHRFLISHDRDRGQVLF